MIPPFGERVKNLGMGREIDSSYDFNDEDVEIVLRMTKNKMGGVLFPSPFLSYNLFSITITLGPLGVV